MPVYCTLHLALTYNSGPLDRARLRDPMQVKATVPAIWLGYILQTALMAYPFEDANLRQWLCAIWQAFPIWVVLLQWFFAEIAKRTSLGQDSFRSPVQIDREALNDVYSFGWNTAVFTTLCTYALIIVARLSPGLFPAGVAGRLTFENAFIPGSPHSYVKMGSEAAAMHEFLNYDLYIGGAASIVWAVVLWLRATPGAALSSSLRKGIVTSLLLAGPGGALIALLQQKDERILSAEAKAEKIK